MKKLFAIVAMVAACSFWATTSVMAQEDEAVTEDVTAVTDDSTAVDTMAEEEEIVEAAPIEEEENEGIFKTLKTKYIEGGAGFMSLVAIALVLGLAFCIERVVYLSLAQINTRKFTEELADLVAKGKIADANVTTAKIADANVTDVKLAHDADFLTEQRIGMFDGRPLYRLIIQATTGSSTNAVNYIKTFAMNNWYEVISIYGAVYQTDKLTAFPMDGSYDRPFLGGAVSGTNYQIYEQHPASFYSSKTCRVTIEYTKAS